MYGIPYQSSDSFTKTLSEIGMLAPEHISAYGLIVEEGTPFGNEGSNLPLPTTDEECDMYDLCRDMLRAAGYEHYEISNFALPGYHSRHNSSYWQGIKYIGIGPGAHSYDGLNRRWNLSSLTDYIATPQEDDVPHEVEHLTTEERYDERIITELRTTRGINLAQLLADFGAQYHTHCLRCATPYINRGQLIHTDENRLHLTPESLLISDAVMRDLLYE